MADEREVYIREARLSFPHLLEKQKASETAEPKYSASFIIDPKTKTGKKAMSEIRAALEAACQDKWKKPFEKMRFKDDRCCFLDGSEIYDTKSGEVRPETDGMWVVKASNKNRVDLRHKDKSPVDPHESPFFAGCYVQAIVRFYGTDNGGAPGLFASLELVRYVKRGQSFGSPKVDDSVLEDLDDDEDEDEDDDDMLD